MLVATYNYKTNKLRQQARQLPTGKGKWVVKIWARGQENKLDFEIRPKEMLQLGDLYDLIQQQVDELLDEMPEGLDMGWEIYKWR